MKRKLAILLIGLAVTLPGLGRLTLERQQELRVALVARDMAEGGSWLIPQFQRQPRLRKPPLSYWLTALPCSLLGRTDSPSLMRLPSAVAGIGLLLVILSLGSRLLGRRTGLAAAGIAALSFGFIRHARLAETDITLSLCIAGSVAAGVVALRRGSLGWWALSGAAAGLGFLTKGPAALIIPPLVLGLFALSSRPAQRRFKGWSLPLATLAFALIALPWYVFVWSHPEARAAVAAEAAALVGPTKHPGPLYYYLYTLPKMLLPWSLLLPWALIAAWKARHHAGVRLGLIWLGVVFVLLTLLPSKQDHYALLALAPVALLLGYRLQRIQWPVWTALPVAILVGVYAWVIYPRTNDLARVPRFLTDCAPLVSSAEVTHVVGINSAIFEFYYSKVVHNIDSPRAAYDRAAGGDPILIIQKHKQLPPDPILPEEPVMEESGKDFRFMLYLK